ncbi:YqiA/YcfP family alpha/beta fold hydrolase [Xylophilus sp.]|uniref:YqiA/YcfP family alpha/beta fold hydrolase n=1 Tax=Xylophilus sp. TaxID=2653893 RepID=UPI0013B6EAC8|nr:YqiA/YcfP family alpha/beta fold hydrolase [Xylophilus sp.]KAF1046403.1 MAG: hypothetical protein GAK38_02470 [Xylophilus sp.]
MPATTHLLYLHGFRSSPRSAKARMVAERVARDHPAVTFWCPQLPPSPRQAMAMVAGGIAGWPRAAMAVIGSSLGGFYAGWVAQRMRCPSVLLNPAVDPARDLARYIGEHPVWQSPEERVFFRAEYIDELRALDVRGEPPAAPAFAVIAKGDEVLDWREMAARCAHARLRLLDGSNHALDDFASQIDEVFDFLQLAR